MGSHFWIFRDLFSFLTCLSLWYFFCFPPCIISAFQHSWVFFLLRIFFFPSFSIKLSPAETRSKEKKCSCRFMKATRKQNMKISLINKLKRYKIDNGLPGTHRSHMKWSHYATPSCILHKSCKRWPTYKMFQKHLFPNEVYFSFKNYFKSVKFFM